MNKEDIIRMVQEARQGVFIYYNTDEQLEGFFERFAKLVADKEREACAKVCDNKQYVHPYHDLGTLIRARGEA